MASNGVRERVVNGMLLFAYVLEDLRRSGCSTFCLLPARVVTVVVDALLDPIREPLRLRLCPFGVDITAG